MAVKITKLRVLRGDRTQSEVAEALGLKLPTYKSYEQGARSVPDKLKSKIADYYGASVGWLFYDDGSPPEDFEII